MFLRPYLSAVSLVTATSLDDVNGVGGKAVMPSGSKRRLDLVVGRLRVLGQVGGVLLEEHEQRGAGVLGVGADLPAFERGHRGLLVGEVEVRLGGVARGREALGVDLAEHALLGEALGADRERDLGVVGVVDDLARRVGGRGRRSARSRCRWRAPLVVAARGDDRWRARPARARVDTEFVSWCGLNPPLGETEAGTCAVLRTALELDALRRDGALDGGEAELGGDRQHGDDDRGADLALAPVDREAPRAGRRA